MVQPSLHYRVLLECFARNVAASLDARRKGVCLPSCGFSDTPEEHEIEVIREHVDDVEILIISKKGT